MPLRTLIAITALLASSFAQAALVDWRQGAGNSGDHFTTSTGEVSLPNVVAANLTLGLRAVERGVGTITPVGTVYHVDIGSAPGAPTRARWNFDIFAQLDPVAADAGFDLAEVGQLARLSSLTLSISTIGGSQPSAAIFDLLAMRSLIDCHVTGCVNGAPVNPDAGVLDTDPLVANPALFFNASQNPIFAPWFTAFDFERAGIYDLTLSANGGAVSTSIRINVGNFQVPEPATWALVGLALIGVAARRKASLG